MNQIEISNLTQRHSQCVQGRPDVYDISSDDQALEDRSKDGLLSDPITLPDDQVNQHFNLTPSRNDKDHEEIHLQVTPFVLENVECFRATLCLPEPFVEKNNSTLVYLSYIRVEYWCTVFS